MKEWSRPELVVLGRGTPQESVLTFCKGPATLPNTGPGAVYYGKCDVTGKTCKLCLAVGVVS